MGHAHVDDIVFAQVDLRRRAGAFEQNQLIFAGEPSISADHFGKKLLDAPGVIIGRRNLSPDLSQEDHLGAGICRRFEQDGIHVDARHQLGKLLLAVLAPGRSRRRPVSRRS